MKELIHHPALSFYECSDEGVKRFLADAQKNEEMERTVREARQEFDHSKVSTNFEGYVKYAIQLNKERLKFIENCQKSKMARNLTNLEIDLKNAYHNKPTDIASLFNLDSTLAEKTRFQLLEYEVSLSTNSEALAEDLGEDRPKLEDIDLERDLMLVKFMQEFYRKYALVYVCDKEADKAAKLRVQVRLANNQPVCLTRNEMDDLVTDYRATYTSFCSLKKFLDPKEAELFDKEFSLANFIKVKSDNREKLNFHPSPFNVVWTTLTTEKHRPDEVSTKYIKAKVFDSLTVSIIKDYYDRTLTDDLILHMMCRKHLNFINFLLKVNINIRTVQANLDRK